MRFLIPTYLYKQLLWKERLTFYPNATLNSDFTNILLSRVILTISLDIKNITFILAVFHIPILHFAYMMKIVADKKNNKITNKQKTKHTINNQYTERAWEGQILNLKSNKKYDHVLNKMQCPLRYLYAQMIFLDKHLQLN